MVAPTCFPPIEARRYVDCGIPPYMPPYTERRFYQDVRTSNMSDRDGLDDNSAHRKRIAVACGRCRKRKIRCSGDTGTGQPCMNCKNSGHVPCQFLRVSSRETTYKGDGFSYSLDASRQYHARGHSVVPAMPPMGPPYPENVSIPATEAHPYRNNTEYAYNGKPYYAVSGWTGGYVEGQSTECGVYPHPYHAVHEPGYVVSPSRVVPSSTGNKVAAPIYVDTGASYGYTNASPATPLEHRSAGNAESGPYPLPSTTAPVVSSTSSGGERMLPAPPAQTLPSSGPQPYRNGSILSGYSKNSQTSSTTAASSPSSFPEAHTGYTSYDNSSLSSYPPASATSQLMRSNDLYTTSSSSDSHGDGPLRTTSSGPELTYRYTDTTRRGSPSTPSPGPMSMANSHSYLSHSHVPNSPYTGAADLSGGPTQPRENQRTS